MKKLSTASQCVKSSMIAWVHYSNVLQRECFVYPQYSFRDYEWFEIDKTAFPNNGSFLAVITGSSDSQQIQEKYGSLVIAKVNAYAFEDNSRYEPTRDLSSKYKLPINPAFYRGSSDLEFEAFSETPFSSNLVQIISSDASRSFFQRPSGEVISYSDADGGPVCQTILVRAEEADAYRYYGPFEYALTEDGEIRLHALDSFDFRIGEFTEISDDDLLTILDKDQNDIATFIEANKIRTQFDVLDSDKQYDWLPNTELIEVLCRVVGSMGDFKTLGKSQLRKMKSEIRSCSEKTAHLRLDDGRKNRLNDAIVQMEDLLSLDDDLLRPIINQLDDDRLAQLVASDRLFPVLQERLLETAGIRERIMEEEKLLQGSLNDLRNQIIQIEKKRLEAEAEVKAATDRAKKATQEAEKVQEEILGQKQEELKRLEAEIAKAREEKDKVTDEYEQAIAQRLKAREALNQVFDGINDEVAASTKILESEVLKKVVEKVHDASLPQTADSPRFRFKAEMTLRSEEDPRVIAEEIYDALSNDFGRECTYNDVANYMICLMQGYITTFAGLPGTGKTSLCNSLCDVLGLKNPLFGNRFVEVNVENGWTSYKDYIGYYNPLSKSYEKANVDVYDSMMSLKDEVDIDISYSPFIYILDEANLSPMEHYWSPFLRACDSFDKGAALMLGGSSQWQLPSHMRFLATVNFDHTTEALSNRFLDRSWVIVLDPIQIDIDEIEGEGERGFNYSPFAYSTLMKAFGKTEEGSISPAIRMQYEKIMRICKDNHFNVSPRSQSMIRNYVSTAERIMKTESRDSQFAPLDYAVAQKILPLIYGPSEKVGSLISALDSECGQLQVTRARLEKMRRQGDESGFYQFFV